MGAISEDLSRHYDVRYTYRAAGAFVDGSSSDLWLTPREAHPAVGREGAPPKWVERGMPPLSVHQARTLQACEVFGC